MTILTIMGSLCFLYFLVIIIYSGPGATFAAFWAGLGLAFFVLAAVAGQLFSDGFSLPVWGAVLLGAGGISVLAVFLWIEGQILCTAWKRAHGGGEVVLILGAQVRGRVPTKSLRRRVRAGADYLHENPGACVIVSGGQGPGELISEAECMKELLCSMGIEPERITMEDKSGDTFENIKNSLALCGKKPRIVIVTCGYHMYRALALAKKAGAEQAKGYPAKSSPVLLVNYYVREFFAVLNYKARGVI